MLKNIMNKINKNKKKKKGFTLIELIIVIAIIAILAAIALPKFMSVRENSNIKADISNAKNIHTVVATLIADDKIPAVAATYLLNGATGDATQTVDKLQSTEALKAKGYKNDQFEIHIDAQGEVSIFTDAAGTGTDAATQLQIYPIGGGIYAPQ